MHHRPDRGVGAHLVRGLAQLLLHLGVQRVHRRPIQPDRRHARRDGGRRRPRPERTRPSLPLPPVTVYLSMEPTCSLARLDLLQPGRGREHGSGGRVDVGQIGLVRTAGIRALQLHQLHLRALRRPDRAPHARRADPAAAHRRRQDRPAAHQLPHLRPRRRRPTSWSRRWAGRRCTRAGTTTCAPTRPWRSRSARTGSAARRGWSTAATPTTTGCGRLVNENNRNRYDGYQRLHRAGRSRSWC